MVESEAQLLIAVEIAKLRMRSFVIELNKFTCLHTGHEARSAEREANHYWRWVFSMKSRDVSSEVAQFVFLTRSLL